MKIIFSIILLLFTLPIFAQQNNLSWVDSLYREGDINAVLVKLDSLNRSNPDNINVILKLGDSYYRLNMLSDADYFYKKSLKHNPKSVRGLFGLAKIDFINGNLDSAKVLLDEVISLKSNLFAPYSILGKIFLMKDNIKKAKYYFHKSLQIDSTNVESLTNLGLIFQSVGESRQAEKYLERAVKFNPNDQIALKNLGIFYGSVGNNHKAIINLNKALKLNPSDPNIYLSLGVNYLSNKIFSEAKKYFIKVIELDKLNLDAHFYLLLVDFEQKSFGHAIKQAEVLSSLKDNYQQLHLILSNIYFLMNNTDKALKEAQKEIDFYPDEVEAYYMLGGLYKYNGNIKKYNGVVDTILTRFGIEKPNLILKGNRSVGSLKGSLINK